MKLVRFIFAPLFWLRDIRNSLAQIEKLCRWKYCLNVRYSTLSTKRKKELLTIMLKTGRTNAADAETRAADILKVLEFDN